MKTLIILLISINSFANFETTTNQLNFSNNDPIKEIIFLNNSQSNSSINPSVFTDDQLNQTSPDFSVALNRCLNVKPQRRCSVYFRFNYKNLIGSEVGTTYSGYLSPFGIPFQGTKFSQSQSVGTSIVDVSGLNFLTSFSSKRSEAKQIVFTNQGDNVQPTINISNNSNFKILINRCNQILKKGRSCLVAIVYEPKETNTASGSLSINGHIIPLSGSKNIDIPPLGDNSLSQIDVEVLNNIGYIQSLSQGNNLTWSLSGTTPVGLSILSNGELSFTPSINQVGSYSFNIIAQNSSGIFNKPINLKVKPNVSISSLNFNEGTVGNNLILLNLKSGVTIQDVQFQNLHNFLTPLRVKKNGLSLDNYSRFQQDSNGNNIQINGLTTGNNSIEISIDGAIKFQDNSVINLTINTSNGSFNYSYPIQINGLNKPYIKYDIFAVKGNNSITGDRPDQILINSDEFFRLSQGWRTPILTKYRVQQINCNGQIMDDYYGNNNDHQNCVSNNVSTDSETVFWFRQTYSSVGNAIGGRAQGIRHGVVVESSPWFFTLPHELGHNFGLFHTFESGGDFSVFHKDSSDAFPIGRSMYTSITNRGVFFFGDWLPYLFDFTSQYGVVDFTYLGTNDTELDYYSSKKKSLYNNLEGCVFGCNYPNDPFRNGDIVYLGYDLQNDFSGRSSGYACELTSYNSSTKIWTTNCESPATLSQNTINNVMSYWYKYRDENTSFTNGQKSRMDSVINYPSYQFLGER